MNTCCFLPRAVAVNEEEVKLKINNVLRMLFPTFRNVLEKVQHDKPNGQLLLCYVSVESSVFCFVGFKEWIDKILNSDICWKFEINLKNEFNILIPENLLSPFSPFLFFLSFKSVMGKTPSCLLGGGV